jgi:hypothetical protein
MYLQNNKLFLSGDWRYYVFSQATYGLGSDIIPAHGEINLALREEPMDYNYVRVHQTISTKIVPHFYIGTGLHIDGYTNIKDLNLDVANGKYTYHYIYSKKHGFDEHLL